MILLDSNILIDYIKGKDTTKEFIDAAGKSTFFVSTISFMEVYQGCLNKSDFLKTKRNLNDFNEIKLNEDISDVANSLSQRYALSHHIGIPDTIIAATALVYGLELRTLNLKDFRFIPTLKVGNKLI